MKPRWALAVSLLAGLLVAGCGETKRTFQPGNLAFIGLGPGVRAATREEQIRCADLWNSSDMAWTGRGEGGYASVAMRNGGCLVTFQGTRLLSGGLFACEESDGALWCPSHGRGLEYLALHFHLRPFRLVWNASVDGVGHLTLAAAR